MDGGTSANSGGLTRRQIIQRGAVGGAIAWSAPVIQSFNSPAFAQVGTPEEEPCPPGEDLAVGYVKYEVDTDTWETLTPNTGGTVCIDVSTSCLAISEYLVAHMAAEAVVVGNELNVCITIPEDCTMVVAAAAKHGRTGCDTTPDTGSTDTKVCFIRNDVGESGEKGVSNVQMAVECCIPRSVLDQCA